jgi:hypothetical protein
MKVNPKNQMGICRDQNVKGEKIMTKPIIDMFTGSIFVEKHNWQRGMDKQFSLITQNDL